jgi:hypothetical protein
MAIPEVKAVERLLGSGVSYAYAVKAGPWVFLTGHEAYDLAAGVTEAVAGPTGFPLFGRPRRRREGDFILQRMQRVLREFGADLGHGGASTNFTRPRRRSTPITRPGGLRSAVSLPLWGSAIALRLHPDATRNAGTRHGADRRSVDLDPLSGPPGFAG